MSLKRRAKDLRKATRKLRRTNGKYRKALRAFVHAKACLYAAAVK